MVSVTQAFAIDLTGQACTDQSDGEFYGGIAAQGEFMRGAARSEGGKAILCLASTEDDGGVFAMYGGPGLEDAGPVDDGGGSADYGAPPPPDDGGCCPLYGAAPAPPDD